MHHTLLIAAVGLGAMALGCGDDTSGGGGGTGGATTGDTGGGGAQTSGGGGQGGATGGEGGATGGQGGTADCDSIQESLSVTLTNAASCDPNIDIRQCTDTVMGLCCEHSVNPDNAANIAAFESAVNDAIAAGCQARACALVDCAAVGIGVCNDTSDGGKCRFE